MNSIRGVGVVFVTGTSGLATTFAGHSILIAAQSWLCHLTTLMDENRFKRAQYLTNVVQAPQQNIFTFWETKFQYHIVSRSNEKLLLRSGELTCSKPAIITPVTMAAMFEGLGDDAREFAESNFSGDISNLRGLGYQFKNNLEKEEEHELPEEQLIANVMERTANQAGQTAVISAPDDIWSLSLLKVALDTIRRSAPGNFRDLEERGAFNTSADERHHEIECLFEEAAENSVYTKELGSKLQEYGLFEEYEDRFFKLVGH